LENGRSNCKVLAVQAENQKYRGVRGWLLILCLSLAILDPLAIVFSLFSVTSAARPHFDRYPAVLHLIVVSGVCRLALAVFSAYAGVSLWRILPGAVSIATRYLRAVILYSVLAVFLPGLVGLPEDLYREMAASAFVSSFMTISYAGLWYLFLKKSKRVGATYRPPHSGGDHLPE
jgi:asparagine N-glycosylation enzyme membrane subunit Stt3